MSKSLVTLCAAVLAVAATSLSVSTPALAGKHFGGGGGHHFFRHFRPRIIATPVYTETYRVKRVPVVQERKVLVSYADGLGRAYDVASKVWFDGTSRCWTGKYAWTFQNGAWFYGTSRWSQTGTTWTTSAAEAPMTVDCGTVPAFAAKVTTAGPAGAPRGVGGYAEQGDPAAPNVGLAPAIPPVKTAANKPDAEVAKTGDCKQYFPSVGEMLPVTCKECAIRL